MEGVGCGKAFGNSACCGLVGWGAWVNHYKVHQPNLMTELSKNDVGICHFECETLTTQFKENKR